MFKIEDGIVPLQMGDFWGQTPIQAIAVGQSFVIPFGEPYNKTEGSIRTGVSQQGKKSGKKFSVRGLADRSGMRIFRVE